MPGLKTDKLLEGIKCAESPLKLYLGKASRVFLPSVSPCLKVNLMRKLYRTTLAAITNQDAVRSLLSKVDAHSKKMAASVYTTTSAKADMKLGKFIHEVIIDPVAWPSDPEMELHKDVALAKVYKQQGPLEKADPAESAVDEASFFITETLLAIGNGDAPFLAIGDGTVEGGDVGDAAPLQSVGACRSGPAAVLGPQVRVLM